MTKKGTDQYQVRYKGKREYEGNDLTDLSAILRFVADTRGPGGQEAFEVQAVVGGERRWRFYGLAQVTTEDPALAKDTLFKLVDSY